MRPFKCSSFCSYKFSCLYILIDYFISRKGKKSNAPWLLMVTEDGFGKRVPIKAFPKGVAGRVGVIGCKVSIIFKIHLRIHRESVLSFYFCDYFQLLLTSS